MSLKFYNETFTKGDTILNQGDDCDGLYIIQSGTVGIVKKVNKKISLVGVLGEKDFLGGASIFNGEKRSASAVCITEVECIRISHEQVKSFIEMKPEWIKSIFKDLVDKLNKSSDLMVQNNVEKELSFEEYGIEPSWVKSKVKS